MAISLVVPFAASIKLIFNEVSRSPPDNSGPPLNPAKGLPPPRPEPAPNPLNNCSKISDASPKPPVLPLPKPPKPPPEPGNPPAPVGPSLAIHFVNRKKKCLKRDLKKYGEFIFPFLFSFDFLIVKSILCEELLEIISYH